MREMYANRVSASVRAGRINAGSTDSGLAPSGDLRRGRGDVERQAEQQDEQHAADEFRNRQPADTDQADGTIGQPSLAQRREQSESDRERHGDDQRQTREDQRVRGAREHQVGNRHLQRQRAAPVTPQETEQPGDVALRRWHVQPELVAQNGERSRALPVGRG